MVVELEQQLTHKSATETLQMYKLPT